MGKESSLFIVKATIHFRIPTEGGRKAPISSGYRPDHVFEVVD